MNVNLDKSMAALTVGEFLELISTYISPRREPTYVYGIAGICQLFHVSRSTAQLLKDTTLKPAVIQNGRTIVVNVEKARQLFAQKA